MERAEPNKEIRAVLLSIQQQLREAVASGRKGLVRIEPVPFSDRHLFTWEEPRIGYRVDLNLLTATRK